MRPEADIGYRMMPKYWGKGLGTEAVRAALKYTREVLGLQKIIGEVVDQNVASNKLLLKVGFRLDRLRSDVRFQRLVDGMRFPTTKDGS